MESSVSEYRSYIIGAENSPLAREDRITIIEAEILLSLKIFLVILEKQDVIDIFNSLEHLTELLPITKNLKILKKVLDILDLCFSSQKLRREQIAEHKEKMARMTHSISMIAYHVNLYNPMTLSLVELLSDDKKFKEYNGRQGGKYRVIQYDDNLEFEYYIPEFAIPTVTEEGATQRILGSSDDGENVKVSIDSLASQYPNDSHYSICKKIITQKGLNIEEGSPIFDSLLYRIRLAQDFTKYEKRLEIVDTVLSAISVLGKFTFLKYLSLFVYLL